MAKQEAVAKGPGRNRLLTPEQVGRAAFDLVDARGADALTISRLAGELGVSPMTIYGYAESKDAIVAMLSDLLLADLPDVDRDRPWRDAVEDIYLSIFRRLIEHHRVLQAIADSPVFGSAQAHVLEGVLDRLRDAGFEPTDAFELQRAVATYTVGFALFAAAERTDGIPRPRTTWIDELDADRFPRIAEIAPILAGEVDEAQYRRGLRRFLAAPV